MFLCCSYMTLSSKEHRDSESHKLKTQPNCKNKVSG